MVIASTAISALLAKHNGLKRVVDAVDTSWCGNFSGLWVAFDWRFSALKQIFQPLTFGHVVFHRRPTHIITRMVLLQWTVPAIVEAAKIASRMMQRFEPIFSCMALLQDPDDLAALEKLVLLLVEHWKSMFRNAVEGPGRDGLIYLGRVWDSTISRFLKG